MANIDEMADSFGLKLEKREEPEHGPPGNNPAMSSDGDMDGDGDVPDPGADNGDAEQELTILDAATIPDIAEIGNRDGAVAAQKYLDGLTDNLTGQALALERVSAEAMAEIVGKAKSPEDLAARLSEYAQGADPVELGHLFEKAILLAQLAGRFGVQEDL